MKLINSIKASYLCGKATAEYGNRNYQKSYELFSKVEKIDSTYLENEKIYLSVFGQSCFWLKQHDKAFNLMVKSYFLFKKEKLLTHFLASEYCILLKTFIKLLKSERYDFDITEVIKDYQSIKRGKFDLDEKESVANSFLLKFAVLLFKLKKFTSKIR